MSALHPSTASSTQTAALPVQAAQTCPIRLQDLTVAYRGHPAVHHVSGDFMAGALTAIVGPNGAGKTTLLNAIMGRLRPSTGRVELAAHCAGRIAWLPQQAEIDRAFPLQVFDLVAMGLWRQIGSFGRLRATHREAIVAALQTVGLGGFERRNIGELSAGQFQRVLFARTLLQDAPVILLDEPFNAVDARTTDDLLAVVQGWRAEGRTVIAVLHDMAQVRAHFDEALLLARRRVAWGPVGEVLQPAHLASARHMAQAWDEQAPVCEGPPALHRVGSAAP
ncbi:metal ABC transporter ATP-binding protein [Pseudacidovorax intermedius]|uniref:metal ABC transporter ATP-binding protein n=1 Tax=Pseudacidovorax intermedius TaxID=433924 RepID=UPI0026F0B910|nr:ABC transporter ATP-binding protein [Pseudacidovorax intermedius]